MNIRALIQHDTPDAMRLRRSSTAAVRMRTADPPQSPSAEFTLHASSAPAFHVTARPYIADTRIGDEVCIQYCLPFRPLFAHSANHSLPSPTSAPAPQHCGSAGRRRKWSGPPASPLKAIGKCRTIQDLRLGRRSQRTTQRVSYNVSRPSATSILPFSNHYVCVSPYRHTTARTSTSTSSVSRLSNQCCDQGSSDGVVTEECLLRGDAEA